MKKILLTSAGLENKVVENKFMELIGKKAKEIRVLFITTAAVEPEAIQVLPKCLDDMTSHKSQNILYQSYVNESILGINLINAQIKNHDNTFC